MHKTVNKKLNIFVRTAVAITLMNHIAAVYSAPSKNEEYQYYRIQGNTAGELRGQMNRLGIKWRDGKTYDAYTKWDVRWNYKYKEADGLCRLENIAVNVNVVYTLPEWSNRDNASKALQQQWGSYITALKKHEDGHRDIGIGAAVEIEQALEKMKPEKGCVKLERKADRAGDNILKQYMQRERVYDMTTGYGETQGAIFP